MTDKSARFAADTTHIAIFITNSGDVDVTPIAGSLDLRHFQLLAEEHGITYQIVKIEVE